MKMTVITMARRAAAEKRQAVGIDVSKKRLDVSTAETSFAVSNDRAGWAKLMQRFADPKTVVLAVEASGGYEQGVVRALRDQGYDIRVLKPQRVRHYARSIGQEAKNDQLDAAAIRHLVSHLESIDRLPPVSPTLSPAVLEWARLLRQLGASKVQLKTQMEHLHEAGPRKLAEELLGAIEARIHTTEQRLIELLTADAVQRRRLELLRSAPAIGMRSALLLLTWLPELGHVDRHRIARLVGAAPLDNDSGGQQGKRRIRGGRMHLRCALYPPMMSAIQCNPVIKAFYHRRRAAGLTGNQALMACLRKMITILNTMLRTDRPWDAMLHVA
jgi:transposase